MGLLESEPAIPARYLEQNLADKAIDQQRVLGAARR